MKLTKVHRVLGFDQSPWLKTYIDFNTEKRKHARNDFEKDYFKLMNNSVFEVREQRHPLVHRYGLAVLQDLDLYDTSEYPRGHPLYSTVNKKVLGKMKDETHGLPIEEFVGLRPKMYSLLFTENNKPIEKKTAKGVAKHVTKHRIRHAHYRDCLFEKKTYDSEYDTTTISGMEWNAMEWNGME
ncbi:hypothetical protein QZH41_017633 [Actinostola sp. cb2023]|nr:hypothetical protein QZH41_017633 [Actinostola sp. cb2023]